MLAGVADVRPRRAGDANEIKSAVLEEAFVFRRKDGIHQHDRKVFIPHRPPLFARAVKKIGDQFRLDFRRVHFRPALERPDAANALPPEFHGQRVLAPKIGQLRRPDIHRVPLHGVLPQRIWVGLRPVAHARQIIGQLVRSPRLRRGNVFGSGENLCGVLQDVSRQARINHARVLHIVVGEDSARDDKNSKDDPKNRQADSGSKKPSLDPDLQKLLPWAGLPLSRNAAC